MVEINSNKGIPKWEKKICTSCCKKKANYVVRIGDNPSLHHWCEDCVKELKENLLGFYPEEPKIVEKIVTVKEVEKGKTYSRLEHPNHMGGWDDEKLAILQSGLYIDELVEKLGKTEMAIRMKASRMGYNIPIRNKGVSV